MFKKMSVVMSLVIAVTLMAGCKYLGFLGKNLDPKAVAEKFWNANKAGDAEEVKLYVTKASVESIKDDKEEGGMKKGGDFSLGDVKVEGDKATIPTTIKDGDFDFKLQTVVVKEDGKWKVDADQTMMSMFGGAMEEMMKGLGNAMKEGMQEVGTAMQKGMQEVGTAAGEGVKETGEAVKEGVKEIGEVVKQGAVEMGEAVKGLATEAKPVEEKQVAAAPSADKSFQTGDPVLVEWHGQWYPAKVTETKEGLWYIHYDGYSNSWDEWVGPDRIKSK